MYGDLSVQLSAGNDLCLSVTSTPKKTGCSLCLSWFCCRLPGDLPTTWMQPVDFPHISRGLRGTWTEGSEEILFIQVWILRQRMMEVVMAVHYKNKSYGWVEERLGRGIFFPGQWTPDIAFGHFIVSLAFYVLSFFLVKYVEPEHNKTFKKMHKQWSKEGYNKQENLYFSSSKSDMAGGSSR